MNKINDDYNTAFNYLLSLDSIYDDVESIYIDGSRQSTKSMAVGKALIMTSLKNKNTAIVISRLNHNQIYKGIYKTIKKILEKWKVEYIEHKIAGYIQLSNGNYIYFNALNNATGNTRGSQTLAGFDIIKDVDKMYVWFEEASEFSVKELDQAIHAYRGARKYCYIYVWNPIFFGFPLVQTANKLLPYNLDILKKEGQQLSITKDTIIHHTNILINPFLPPQTRKRMLDSVNTKPKYLTDPNVFGYPGVGEGQIFAQYLEKCILNLQNTYEYSYLTVGLDVADKRDAMVLTLLGFTRDYVERELMDEIHILDELFIENGEKYDQNKGLEENGEDIIAKVIEWYKIYAVKIPSFQSKKLVVYTDYGGGYAGYIKFLNNRLAGLSDYYAEKIIFVNAPAEAKKSVKDRIDFIATLMAQGRIKFKSLDLNSYVQYEAATWNTNNEGDITKGAPRKGSDDAQDSVEYGIYGIYGLIKK